MTIDIALVIVKILPQVIDNDVVAHGDSDDSDLAESSDDDERTDNDLIYDSMEDFGNSDEDEEQDDDRSNANTDLDR